jgi:hypothetical protein
MGYSDADGADRGGKTGSGRMASESQQNQERRERLRKLALETIDLNKDPYFMRNHLGDDAFPPSLPLHQLWLPVGRLVDAHAAMASHPPPSCPITASRPAVRDSSSLDSPVANWSILATSGTPYMHPASTGPTTASTFLPLHFSLTVTNPFPQALTSASCALHFTAPRATTWPTPRSAKAALGVQPPPPQPYLPLNKLLPRALPPLSSPLSPLPSPLRTYDTTFKTKESPYVDI